MSSAAEANAAFFPPTGGPPVDSYTSWRDQLLTPSPTPSLGNSPVTGPAAPEDRTPQSLSFPVPIPALQAQLEAWASLSLDPASAASWASLRHGAAAAEASSGWSETWESPHNSFSGEAFPEPGPSCVSQEGGQQPPAPVGSYGSHHSAHAFLSAPPAHHHPYLQQQQAPPGALFAATSVEGLDLVVDDEVLTVAAKEDKRKRNTTASARFRVKKKEREKQLEDERLQLRDKVSSLEREVGTLKQENKWLRDLIMEKTRDTPPSSGRGDETPMPPRKVTD